eukprot:ANDGO_01535.mRNA.1 hypothetical protein NCLIV_025350
MSEIEDTLKRINTHKGVVGFVIVNDEGVVVRSTLPKDQTPVYASLITSLAAKARAVVRDLDPQNDLTFLRIRSKKNEIMVAPDKSFTLIVIQSTDQA